MALAPVGAAGEDEGRDEFPRGGHGPGEHRGHSNRDHRGRGAEALRPSPGPSPQDSSAAETPRFFVS